MRGKSGLTLISKLAKGNPAGFTLIELMVTVSIVAVLMSAGMTLYGDMQKNGADQQREGDLAQIQSALEQYKADQHYYPSSLPAVGSALKDPANAVTYLSAVPGDPSSGASYSYVAGQTGCTTANKNCYSYTLCATLENTTGGSCSHGTGNYEVDSP